MEEQVHQSIESLLQDIIKPTEEREPQAPAPEPPAATNKNNDAAATENKKTEPAERKEIPEDILEDSAELTVGFFDFTQENIFRWRGKVKKNKRLKRLYGEDAPEKLEMLLDAVDAMAENRPGVTTIKEFTPEELGMLRIEKVAQEYFDDLALSKREKELLEKPLKAIMKKRGGEIPPEYLLLLAIVQITGSRGTELAMM